MPGLLLKAQALARRHSLAALVVYVSVLLLAFGHRCVPADTARDGGGAPQGQHVAQALPAGDGTAHACPVCAWQRDTVSTVPVLTRTAAPDFGSVALLPLPDFPPPGGAPLLVSSRGPPLS